MLSITCEPKHHAFNSGGNLWCFDYQFGDELIEDEPLMPEATELVDKLLAFKYPDQNINKIKVIFSSDEMNADIVLKYVEPKDGGSTYKVRSARASNLYMNVWLCPVFDMFFPENRPEYLYVTVVPAD